MSDHDYSGNGSSGNGHRAESSDGSELLPLGPAEPIPDPGLPEHEPRPTDVDSSMEKRAERQVSAMFIGAAALAWVFCICYFMIPRHAQFVGMNASNVALGMTLGIALCLIGFGLIQWAKKLMADNEIVEERHPSGSSEEDQSAALAAVRAGVEESGFGRRKLIRNSLLGAVGLLGLPAIVMLRDLGPLPKSKPEHTVWAKGMRIVNDVAGTPIKPGDVELGQLVNAEPEVFFAHQGPNGKMLPPEYEGTELNTQKAKAAVIVVRMQPSDIRSAHERSWGVDGIVCFSKICTHVGCAISLWEDQTHQLLCPCHQSTFDLANDGEVVFGPAARPLPQLPIKVDGEGYLVAQSDFHEPVGPSFWERGKGGI